MLLGYKNPTSSVKQPDKWKINLNTNWYKFVPLYSNKAVVTQNK